MKALTWGEDSLDGADHGASCAAFASLTLELAAQATGEQSWVTGGSTYPWPLHEWADARIDENPDSPGITSIVQDAEAHQRWHPLGDGYQPQPGDWVLFDQHVEVATASVTIAQAIDESGWGTSQLAAVDHNLFGIKGTGPAGSITLPAQEFENGEWVTIYAQFRAYHNVSENISDHAELLATSGYYQQAMADRAVPDAFANDLTGVYATDPDYGSNLIAIMRLYNLHRSDVSITPVVSRYQAKLPAAVVTAYFAKAKAPLGRAAAPAPRFRDGVPLLGRRTHRAAPEDALAPDQRRGRAGPARQPVPDAVRRRAGRAHPQLPSHRVTDRKRR